jgi:RHS repeat-associated protein
LLETDGNSIIQVVYTLEPVVYGNLISQRRSGATSSYLFDGLGSTRQLASITGAVTDSDLYDSFGNMLVTSGTTVNPFRYVGRLGSYDYYDLSKYDLGARTYDPVTGRFLSRESIPLFPPTSNAYEFIASNPSRKMNRVGSPMSIPNFFFGPLPPKPGKNPGWCPRPKNYDVRTCCYANPTLWVKFWVCEVCVNPSAKPDPLQFIACAVYAHGLFDRGCAMLPPVGWRVMTTACEVLHSCYQKFA